MDLIFIIDIWTIKLQASIEAVMNESVMNEAEIPQSNAIELVESCYDALESAMNEAETLELNLMELLDKDKTIEAIVIQEDISKEEVFAKAAIAKGKIAQAKLILDQTTRRILDIQRFREELQFIKDMDNFEEVNNAHNNIIITSNECVSKIKEVITLRELAIKELKESVETRKEALSICGVTYADNETKANLDTRMVERKVSKKILSIYLQMLMTS